MQDRTRILHLTDLHLRQALSGTAKRPERLSRDMPAVLARLAGQMDALGAATWRACASSVSATG